MRMVDLIRGLETESIKIIGILNPVFCRDQLKQVKTKVLLISLFVIHYLPSKAQSWGDSTYKNENVFSSVEKAPVFNGGNEGLLSFLAENLLLPENKFSIVSTRIVIVKTIIDKRGKIVYAEIEKGVNEACNQEALKTIKKIPAWLPAKQNVFYYQIFLLLF